MARAAGIRQRWRAIACMILLTLSLFDPEASAAPTYSGQVTFNALPVPGAIVTAMQGERRVVAVTDQQGAYTFSDLADGVWAIQVQMTGFATQTQEVTIDPKSAPQNTVLELKLLPLDEITREAIPSPSQNAAPSAPTRLTNPVATPQVGPPPTGPGPNAQAQNTSQPSSTPPAAPQPPPAANTGSNESSSDLQQSAATGLVVNGSVNNGAASAYAQLAAFGNNRKGAASLYNGGAGLTFDTSAWDAAPFSQIGLPIQKPSYNDVTFLGALGGPLGVPHHLISQSQFFVAYQHAETDTAQTLTGLVPTALERTGNLSQLLNAQRQPVQIYNAATNLPYSGNTVPVSPQAAALLNQYPMPNVSTASSYNYQASVLSASQSNSVQSRVSKNKNRNQFFGTMAYQGQASQSTNLFDFKDGTNSYGIDSAVDWQHVYPGFTHYFSTLFKYEFSRKATSLNPYFANRTNVSGNAGVTGNDQSPANWGPPTLLFGASGEAGLSDGLFSRVVNQTQAFTYQSLLYHDKHALQFGGDLRRLQFNTKSQQDPRGTFSFNGAATQEIVNGAPAPGTGSDLADFLLGIPDVAEIAFGNADKYLRGWGYDAYIDDDWRFKTGLTFHAGLRWEFADPLAELKDRLVNLDVAPGFTAASPVLATNPTGLVTNTKYPSSLIRPDYRGWQPRLGIAWRPRSNSPLVIRAGYGVYDNTSVYQVVAMQMAQQPPLSKAFVVQNRASAPLALATAFDMPPLGLTNTFGVDPNFRTGYAQTWNASVQQDLPGSLTMTATYQGIKGTRLMQEYLPNTEPAGAVDPCPSCPTGFVYLGSNGDSTRQSGQIQIRRRLRNGFTSMVQYTYAKAIDDASSFSAVGLSAAGAPSLSSNPTSTSGGTPSSSAPGTAVASIAQNWLNLQAERSRSTFDQRHLLTVSAQYTTGEGVRGGALLSGWRGTLFKDWTVTTAVTVGSGLPLTPVYQTTVTGIGVPWTIRPDVTGLSVTAAPAGKHLNPAAFVAPASGQWGDAGRDSIAGPAQFALNASFSRVFRLGSRVNAQWETSATNVLNAVTFANWNTNVTSPLFGLPGTPNAMRKLQSTFRVRF